ncbi:MAG: hypothetical protein RIM84_05325 [Alphaproteobacteria bacterium]
MTELDGSRDYSADPAARQAEWYRYYSEKRIGHQWFQVHLLAGLPVRRVLEIGPGLGLVTAMLHNAGFAVTTLDRLPAQADVPTAGHIEAELTEVEPDRLAGHDAILCCETLEHLWWDDVDAVLAKLRAAAPRYLIVSVPYQGLQLDLRLYLNPHRWRGGFAFKKLYGLRRFRADADGDPWGHKWEAGYRGHSLKAVQAKLAAASWRVRRRDFTSPTRSVFYLLEPA